MEDKKEIGTKVEESQAGAQNEESDRSDISRLSLVEIACKLTLSYEEAAALSGISERQLRNAAKQGKLHVMTVGYGNRMQRAELNRYVGSLD